MVVSFSDEVSIIDWDRSQLNYAAYDASVLFRVTPLMSILGKLAPGRFEIVVVIEILDK